MLGRLIDVVFCMLGRHKDGCWVTRKSSEGWRCDCCGRYEPVVLWGR